MMHRVCLATVTAVLASLVSTGIAAADSPPPTPPAETESAFVLDVIDGDTIRVDRDGGGFERVRYIGIDSPEIAHQPGETDEPWGPQATEANEELVRDRFVLLERDVSDRDRYDRLLRYVWVETSAGWVMVNGRLVADGLAVSRAYEPDTRHQAWLEQLEAEAWAAGRGVHGPAPDETPDETESFLESIIEFFLGG